MGKRPTFEEAVSKWPTDKRIKKAKTCVKELTVRVQDVLHLHAANKIIQYSNKLGHQITRPPAATAFHTFRHAMISQEIIQLLALWDNAAKNAISIPTAIVLIDDTKVLSELQSATFDAHAGRGARILNPSGDPEIQSVLDEMVEKHQQDFASKQARLAVDTLQTCIAEVGRIRQREEMTSIRNLRNHLSHSLTQTRSEAKGPVRKAKYGDEKKLLERTTRLVENLYCWVNGTSFDISGRCREQAVECAKALWLNCRFDLNS